MISKSKLMEYLNDTIEHNSKELEKLRNKQEQNQYAQWTNEALQGEARVRIWFAVDLVDMIEQGEFDEEKQE